ncbi:n-alkane-inducible cytochrome P450 [Aspergillus minisclerotigenes]|uniref:N-alkane-inducible cytochrome P450 n=1 Tax=Aspergillus minisclerotigenes TaxID=656917 RepID=A0A5N6JC92_9EURO|nr:n-alkane-inducible cytochrome P450 [Aspergillus minisclerotigenes]
MNFFVPWEHNYSSKGTTAPRPQDNGLCYHHLLYYLLIVLYWPYRNDHLFEQQHGCEPPPELPTTWPFGLDRIKELWTSNTEGRLLAFLCSVAEHYEPGNSLSQYLLLGPRAFHVPRPQNVEVILSTKFEDYGFGARREIFAPLLGNGILTQEGPAWKHSRDLSGRQFSQIKSRSLEHFHEHVDNLIARLSLNVAIDLQPLPFDLTLDITTALLFGKSVAISLAVQSVKVSKSLLKIYSSTEPNHEAYSFIKQIFQNSFSKTDIRDQLLNLLLAGRDTTTWCLSWMIRLLVRHGHVMCRLRDEISSITGRSGYPTRDQMRRMAYLDCVIKETLRLYPPVPLNNREAKETTILPNGGGETASSPILVRKEEPVVFSQYVNSRKKNIYGPDADIFRPERWETGELDLIGWACFPFNGGPRQCLGKDSALTQVKYTAVRLLQTFPSIRLPAGELVEPVGCERQCLTLVLSCADGGRVEIRSS